MMNVDKEINSLLGKESNNNPRRTSIKISLHPDELEELCCYIKRFGIRYLCGNSCILYRATLSTVESSDSTSNKKQSKQMRRETKNIEKSQSEGTKPNPDMEEQSNLLGVRSDQMEEEHKIDSAVENSENNRVNASAGGDNSHNDSLKEGPKSTTSEAIFIQEETNREIFLVAKFSQGRYQNSIFNDLKKALKKNALKFLPVIQSQEEFSDVDLTLKLRKACEVNPKLNPDETKLRKENQVKTEKVPKEKHKKSKDVKIIVEQHLQEFKSSYLTQESLKTILGVENLNQSLKKGSEEKIDSTHVAAIKVDMEKNIDRRIEEFKTSYLNQESLKNILDVENLKKSLQKELKEDNISDTKIIIEQQIDKRIEVVQTSFLTQDTCKDKLDVENLKQSLKKDLEEKIESNHLPSMKVDMEKHIDRRIEEFKTSYLNQESLKNILDVENLKKSLQKDLEEQIVSTHIAAININMEQQIDKKIEDTQISVIKQEFSDYKEVEGPEKLQSLKVSLLNDLSTFQKTLEENQQQKIGFLEKKVDNLCKTVQDLDNRMNELKEWKAKTEKYLQELPKEIINQYIIEIKKLTQEESLLHGHSKPSKKPSPKSKSKNSEKENMKPKSNNRRSGRKKQVNSNEIDEVDDHHDGDYDDYDDIMVTDTLSKGFNSKRESQHGLDKLSDSILKKIYNTKKVKTE